uniref:Putative group i salivary lipocalin n=1 Tax=Rhipicephalus pulchellus TaxID=72859 RepID=L7M8K4_RHIPC
MLKITVLALVLSAAGTLCNVAEAKVPKALTSTPATTGQHLLKEFWSIYKKVWTANSTVPIYGCEWEEPDNMTETGLQIKTHFDTVNSFTLNWTFTQNNTMKSELPEGEFRRSMVYRNWTCAVFKDEFWRKTPLEDTTTKKPAKKPKKKGKKEKKKKGKKGKKEKGEKLTFSGVQYRMVFDDTKKGHVPDDCRQEYRNVIGTATNYRIYKNACRKALAQHDPKRHTPDF